MAFLQTQDSIKSILPFFQEAHLALVVEAVAAGNSPGKFYADSPTDPEIALVWDRKHCLYLGGRTDTGKLVPEFRVNVQEEILPYMRGLGLEVARLAAPSGWEEAIEGLFPQLPSRRYLRGFYRMAGASKADWRAGVPQGMQVRQIDRDLLSEERRKNLPELKEEIRGGWKSQEDFLEKGFGFCMVSEDELISWCTGEFFSKGKCGIGIETVEEYQKRGFGALTASAFLEHCQSKGITAYWDTWLWNEPSVRLAEKLGFQKVIEYETLMVNLSSKE
jgi:RimJ/RimL family protein N-acetyltransferase